MDVMDLCRRSNVSGYVMHLTITVADCSASTSRESRMEYLIPVLVMMVSFAFFAGVTAEMSVNISCDIRRRCLKR